LIATKYPVITERGEYRVAIESGEGFVHDMFYFAFVQVKKKSLILRRMKWKTVNEYSVEKDRFRGEYVKLAKLAVEDYEEMLDERLRREELHREGIEEWNNWDGKMK